MKPRHQISRGGLELIKRFEGYRRAAARLSEGGWTIGYGHTKSAREGAEVSEADAEALLIYDLIAVQADVNRLTYTPLTQNQYDALVSFAFNIGPDAFRTSGVLRRINEGSMLQAAFALEMWRKSDFEGERIVIDALIRRRSAEKALFLTPTEGYVPAPSPILVPRIDYDAAMAEPRQLPLNLVVALDGEVAEAHLELIEALDQTAPPSAAAAAADAVTHRLQTLFPENGEPLSPVVAATPQDVSPEASREGPAREAVDPVSAPAAEMTGEPEVDQLVMPAATPAAPAIYQGPDDPAAAPSEIEVTDVRIGPMGVERRKKKPRWRLLPYAPLLVLGIAFFVGGVVWQALLKDGLGLGLALLGGLLTSVSLYYLLQQIDEDQPQA